MPLRPSTRAATTNEPDPPRRNDMDDISAAMADAAARHIKGHTIAWGGGECYNFDEQNPEIIPLEDEAVAWAYNAPWRGQTRLPARRMLFGFDHNELERGAESGR